MMRLLGILAAMLRSGSASPDQLGSGLQSTDRGLLAPSSEPACNAFGQRNMLLIFYNIMNGDDWVNRTGWPSIPNLSPVELIAHMAAFPVTTETCMASDGSGIMLPDHCW